MYKIVYLSLIILFGSLTATAQSAKPSPLYPRLKPFYSTSQIKELTQLVGKEHELFNETLQTIVEEEDKDQMDAQVISGAVPGLYTLMECIIMITPKNEVMAAIIKEDEVLFFTNSPKFIYEQPVTIEEWRSNFADKPVKTILSKELEEKVSKEAAEEYK